jgi:hypothetical protein
MAAAAGMPAIAGTQKWALKFSRDYKDASHSSQNTSSVKGEGRVHLHVLQTEVLSVYKKVLIVGQGCY